MLYLIMYDIILIWWWASSLFFCANINKNLKIAVLEKTNHLGTKLLMAGWWRCNYTNLNANAETYLWKNIKMLKSVFHKFWPQETLERFHQRWLESEIEDNWRAFPKSRKSKDVLDLLIKKSKDNNIEFYVNSEVLKVDKKDSYFEIKTKEKSFKTKKMVIATWGKSFPNTGTTWFAYKIVKQFDIEVIKPYPWLCWLETIQNFSNLSWSSAKVKINLFCKNKLLVEKKWTLLFTHRWISWPIVFDLSLFIGKIIQQKKYQLKDFYLEIEFLETTKRIRREIDLNIIKVDILKIRDWNEAKVTGGWISMDEINPDFQSKKVSWLYFLWECLDCTGYTWGYNFQWCRSSAFLCRLKNIWYSV